MNWGHGLTLFFVGFVLFMSTLVVICMRQDNIHLVTQNYYEEEIKYQDRIDKIANAADLGYKVFNYHVQDKTVGLNLPPNAVGVLHLFRPSDARLDRKFDVEIESGKAFTVNLSDLKPGYWRMKLTWEEGGKEYYLEERITI